MCLCAPRGGRRHRVSSSSGMTSAGRSTTTPPASHGCAPARLRRLPRLLGTLREASGRLPCRALRRAQAALARFVASARPVVLPRSPRDPRLPRVRRGVRSRCAAMLRASIAFRSRTREMEELVLEAGVDPFEGLQDPDRRRHRALSARRCAGSRRLAPGARHCRSRLSSSARSRRTASAGGKGSSRSRSRAPTRSSRRSSCCGRAFRISPCC